MAKKKITEKIEENPEILEKFANFFEQKNSKVSANKIMWAGVTFISLGVLFFVVYAAKLQINSFAWDQATIKTKNDIQKQWENSFATQEKEKNIEEIKKQVSEFLQQIVSTTTSTPTINTSTVDLVVTNTLNIASSTTSSINNN